MTVLWIFAAFLCLLLFPIFYAYFVSWKKTESVLYINQDKVRDPRYFAKSFAAMVHSANIDSHAGVIMLSKPEKIEQISEEGFEKPEYDSLVFSSDRLLTLVQRSMSFKSEVYAEGDVCLAGESVLRSLCVEGNLIIGTGVLVGRWADAEGTAAVYDNCNLGISMTSAKGLSVGNNCEFQRLFAPELLMGVHPDEELEFGTPVSDEVLALDVKKAAERNVGYVMDDMRDENGTVPYTLICNGDLVVTEGLVIQGHIRTGKGVRLCEGAIVCGNIFAEENIVLGRGCRVLGTVFTQGSITFEDGAAVGRAGEISSVVARDDISVRGRARVFGYVCCARGAVNKAQEGAPLCAPEYNPRNYEFLYFAGCGVPRLSVAASNARLRKISREELYRFETPRFTPSWSVSDYFRDSYRRHTAKLAHLTLALAGVCAVCALAVFAAGKLTPTPAEPTVISDAERYRAEGLVEGTELQTEPVTINDDCVVFEDRVLKRFTATSEDVIVEAEVYGSIFGMIPDSVNKYMMLVPLRIYYEDDWKQYTGPLEEETERFASLLPQNVTFIDLLSKLNFSKDSYLFYRTEPYWAAEGAYYGAKAFFDERGEDFAPLDTYNVELYESFEGSLYEYYEETVLDVEGEDDEDDAYKDRVYMFTQPGFRNQETLYRRQNDGTYAKSLEPILSKTRTGMSTYVGNSTFSHAIIDGSVKNGKTLLLIGDSSVKIIASFFYDKYETIYVINQKWYSQEESRFSQIFDGYNVTDALILQSAAGLDDELERARTYRIVQDNAQAQVN